MAGTADMCRNTLPLEKPPTRSVIASSKGRVGARSVLFKLLNRSLASHCRRVYIQLLCVLEADTMHGGFSAKSICF